MDKKPKALERAVKGVKIQTRARAEIESDLGEVIKWAETAGRELPVRLKKGRPFSDNPGEGLRSITVKFPAGLAAKVETAAKRKGLSVSEFVRAAALAAIRREG
jgi:hypothetical protein